MHLMNYMIKYLINKPIIYLIYFYRWCISIFIPSNCRFYPTCSMFAIKAIQKHGVVFGLYYSFIRILKCHPFNHAEYCDPVP